MRSSTVAVRSPFSVRLKKPCSRPWNSINWTSLSPSALASSTKRRAMLMGATRVLSYNHLQKRYVTGMRREPLLLVTQRKLRRLFPDSAILPLQITFWPETLIAAGPRASLPDPLPSLRQKR